MPPVSEKHNRAVLCALHLSSEHGDHRVCGRVAKHVPVQTLRLPHPEPVNPQLLDGKTPRKSRHRPIRITPPGL